MTLAIERFCSTEEAARALAGAVALELEAALAQQPRALLLVSGGRSPLALFAALRVQPIAWERIDISLVDERCIAADVAADDAANAALVCTHLLRDAAAAARWIALVPDQTVPAGATPFERAQDAADRANCNPLLARAAVIVLGVGSDGHTASLFADAPQWPRAQVTPQRYLALQPGAAPHARISLSLSALRQQGRCHVWAVGAEKSEVLTRLQARVSARAGARAEATADDGAMACLIADPALALTAYCTPDGAA